ncbi:hypothetical protein DFQ07_1131 [Tenacibaculum caenipelagi]|uniref:Uncharacterized protein n=1 Tax=Tenacibaculum caenipelagi TaxID=1325435 RepID=A0A4R6TKR0_9FLAO|nr:hypothetical protein DFQ07_1131 [Tenacibaculum caenipelagi]
MKLIIKTTPIFLLSLIFIPLSIFGSIYYTFFDNKGGMALAGTLFIGILIFNLIILFVEQSLIKKDFNRIKVWLIEVIIILLIVLYFYFFR